MPGGDQAILSCDGLLVVDKPAGMTSHDVVDEVRAVLGQRRVGHAGTLDPLATGLLLVCVGRATRLVRFLQEAMKTYSGSFVLGITTDTLDADGRETARHPCPATPADIREAMSGFTGTIEQTPPMASAVKVGGRKLYELARKGVTVPRKARSVQVDGFVPLSTREADFPQVDFQVTCSSGTYVRALAADVGAKLGCGAHLTSLRRVRSGSYSLDDAHPLDELRGLSAGEVESLVIPMEAIDLGIPALEIGSADAASVAHGRPLGRDTFREVERAATKQLFSVTSQGRLLGVYHIHPGEGSDEARAVCVVAPGGEQEMP